MQAGCFAARSGHHTVSDETVYSDTPAAQNRRKVTSGTDVRIVKPYGRSEMEFGGKDEIAWGNSAAAKTPPRLHDYCPIKKSRGRIQAFRQMLGLEPSLKV